jgi:glycine/D-amino acid oxidase-like deaminating enzyme
MIIIIGAGVSGLTTAREPAGRKLICWGVKKT